MIDAALAKVDRELVGLADITAARTREMVRKALGGVLFIDEAYSIHRDGSERDFGQEVVDVLLTAMEDHREDLVVILAGYRDRTETFFRLIPERRSGSRTISTSRITTSNSRWKLHISCWRNAATNSPHRARVLCEIA